MEKIIYTQNSLQSIALFESMLNVHVKDMIVEEDKMYVVLEKDEFDKVMNRTGFSLRHLESVFKKHIKLVKFEPELTKFISNLLYPLKVKNVSEEDGVVSIVPDEKTYKGLLIGKNGDNLNFLKKIAHRYFEFKNIVVV